MLPWMLAGAGIRDARTRVRSNKGKNRGQEHREWMDTSCSRVGPDYLAAEQRPASPLPHHHGPGGTCACLRPGAAAATGVFALMRCPRSGSTCPYHVASAARKHEQMRRQRVGAADGERLKGRGRLWCRCRKWLGVACTRGCVGKMSV
jgi:hypothetical protein